MTEMMEVQTGTVVLKGSLNIQHASRLKEMLLESLGRVHRLLIHVEEIEEIDLSCLQTLCSAHRTAIRSAKEISLEGRWSEGFRSVVEKSGYWGGGRCGSPQNVSCLWKSGECNG